MRFIVPPSRRNTLLWLGLGMLALALLAGGLRGLNLQPGHPFALPQPVMPTQTGATAPGSSSGDLALTLIRGMLAFVLLLLPVTLVFALFSKQGRRRLLTNALLALMLFFLADRIKESTKNLPQAKVIEPLGSGLNSTSAAALPPLPAPPAPPDWLIYLASLLLVLLVVGLVAWLARRALKKRPLPPMVELANEADKARAAIQGGEALEDVVVRCYRQMGLVAIQARDLRRPKTMTPREFEAALAEAGLPAAPVRALTRVFEDVRYGGIKPGPAERQAAISSLEAIAAACRKP